VSRHPVPTAPWGLRERSSPSPIPRVRFQADSPFFRELKRRAATYLDASGSDRRDVPRMWLKTFVLLSWFTLSWALLVFAAATIWQAVLLAVSLGLAIAGIGMGIQHDANHGAYSRHHGVNVALGLTLDLMGVNSYIWRHKHNAIHHTFTNVEGVDFDLDFGSIARLTPKQRRRPWHRFQHLYIWVLYGFLLPKWVLIDDFVHLYSGKMGPHPLAKPRPMDLVQFFLGKIVFLAWAFVVPVLFHPPWLVGLFLFLAVFTMGVTLSTVFQLAHCVENADFPEPAGEGGLISEGWAEHQVATTVDFAPNSPVLTWFLSGLSFQVEHHLFPKVCHLHYPALARIVEEVAREHGVRYRVSRTFGGAIASHFRLLRKLGQADPEAPRERAEVTS
jgi:linoleoyl-CoA desaturase